MRKIVALMLLWVGVAMGALPQAPQTFDTTYKLPVGGKTWVVRQSNNLQTVLDAAQPGDVISLSAGATWVGNFKLPPKSGNGWIYVVSDERGWLQEGNRVGLSGNNSWENC